MIRTINILFLIIALGSFINCSNTNNNKSIDNNKTAEVDMDGTPLIKFEEVEHDFGQIFQGEKVSYIFKFKNIGSADLIIKNAAASCGCTVPKFPHDPVAPGDFGEIEVVFDSSGRHGKQLKTITVWTNCDEEQLKLKITSEIVEHT